MSLHPTAGGPEQAHVPTPAIKAALGATGEVLAQLGARSVGEAPPGIQLEAMATLARLVADLEGQPVGDT
eukprot:8458042-Alexandrium_andersonii.AAC.1